MLMSLVIPAMLLGACATSREVRLADGWMTHVISCGGSMLNMGHCLEKAGDVCGGRGYQILNSEGGELPASTNAIPTGGLSGMGPSSDSGDAPRRKLYIKCR